MSNVKVISLGGSLIAPDKVDQEFLKSFYRTIEDYLMEDESRKIILVCGGGSPARKYQKAFREVTEKSDTDAQDWIGIAATKLNAELLKQIFVKYCSAPIVTDPTSVFLFPGRVLIGSGWKPGFSTDFDAVLLAEKFSGNMVINLSNIAKVYTKDPKVDPDAQPIDKISWQDFRGIVGETWIPGKNVPFDPIAAKRASEINMQVIVASGKDLNNLKAILNENSFEGTIIGPE